MSGWLQGVLLLAGAIVTVNSAIGVITAVTGRTVGRRWRAYGKLRLLAAHVDVEFFVSVLGPPVLKRRREDVTERVWVDPAYYFVQAFADADDRVVLFSVTSNSLRFRPKVPFPNGGRYTAHPPGHRVGATLHRTKFAGTGGSPTRIVADLAARRHGYVEVYWFGNPANYQAVALSVSDAGPSVGDGAPFDEINERRSNPAGVEFTEDELPRFRNEKAPNTYTITAPHVMLDDYPPIASVFGADADDVRVLS